jgi:hypothetical protein
MNLTPIHKDGLPRALARMATFLESGSTAARALARISETVAAFDTPYDTPAHRRQAVDLASRLGIPTLDEEPSAAFSWDGNVIRVRSEAYVLIHEIAHWQIALPERRRLVDFGLGAGPETGRVAEADAARCVSDAAKEQEELLASLLGILWEARLGQPAIHAFVEQNWLEAWDRPSAADQFRRTVDELVSRGLIDAHGVPYAGSAATAEISIRNSGHASAETSTMADDGPSLGK